MSTLTRLSFSKKRLEKLPLPEPGQRAEYRDATTAGLVLRITPRGVKTFSLVRRLNGHLVRLTLGKFPAMTVEQARKAAEKLSGEIATGKDPHGDRRNARGEMTLGELWTYWEAYAQRHKRSWREDKRMYYLFLSNWGKRRLSAIRKPDVQGLHNHIALQRGEYQANRAYELLRAMYNKARNDLGYRGENPAVGIKRFREEKRDRFLHADELRAFFAALAAEPNLMVQHFFLIALLTGARRSNVQAMRWADIDLVANVWRIPDTQSGKPVVVPLTTAVLTVLKARMEADGSSEWVFPSHGKTGHLVEPKSAWKRIIKRAGLADVRPHDLRRSLGSWMAMTGASLPIVGGMLGHSQPATTAIYARLAVDPIRAAAETATAAMLAAGGVKLPGETG